MVWSGLSINQYTLQKEQEPGAGTEAGAGGWAGGQGGWSQGEWKDQAGDKVDPIRRLRSVT